MEAQPYFCLRNNGSLPSLDHTASHCLTCPPILPLPPSPSTAQAPTKLHLTLIESGSDDLKQSVNGQLLAAGLARLVEPKGPQVGWF